MKKPKKNTKPVASNNKKESTKSKQMLNKSMEKKKKVGISLTTEPNKNSTIEVRNAKDKIALSKPIKKGGGNQKSSSMTNRSAKSTKSKEYDNKLNEDNDYEIGKTKEYDYFSYKDKNKEKPTKPNEDDTSEDASKDKGDFLYRTMYKTNVDNNKSSNIDNLKTPDTQKIKKDNVSKSKEKPVEQPPGNQFAISMERTDDIIYDIGDKKIHSNIKKSYDYNNYKANNDKNYYKVESDDTNAQKYSDYQNKKNNYNSGSSYDRPSTSTYSSKTPSNLLNERTIDLYVIDTDGEEPVVSTRNQKKIDRTRNKIKEVKIEKYDAKTPIRDEKLTGFVLIRKSKGKRIYDVEFGDDMDKINEILKNKKVMIKNEIIQFVTLTKLTNYERDIKNYTDKISRLQNDINKKDYSKGGDNDNKTKLYEEQISELKSKNLELSKKAFKLQDELDENIREFKQVKLAYDQLKDNIEREKLEKEKMEKEKERERKEKEQVVKEEPSKIKKKAAQMQQDENNDQKAIKEMKLRIKKYKDDLRKPDEKNKIPFTYRQDDVNKGNISPTRKRHKQNVENPENKEIQLQETQPAEEEDDEIGEYVLGDEDAKDPRKRKLKNAVNRFRNKYKEVIKEEKKAQREKEKEEKEREENEERELEDENYQEEKERQEREREELERQERERKEREERERREREERERREREERERREREERERKERERREREEKEKKERERKERERKEKEKRDKEEKERKEREKKEKDKKDNKPAMGGARMGGGKMGGNFAKMLADKLKMAPPGMKKGGGGNKGEANPKPPVIEKNVDMAKLLEEQPFQGRKDKRKPTRKVFVIEDNDE